MPDLIKKIGYHRKHIFLPKYFKDFLNYIKGEQND